MHTHLTILVDHSGSMVGRYSDCINTVCDIVKEDRSCGVPFELRIVFFANTDDLVYSGKSGNNAAALVREASVQYPCGGGTRYFDSVVKQIEEVQCAEKTTIIMATDGIDTASTLHTQHTCMRAVTEFRNAGGRFVYLGMADGTGEESALRKAAKESGVSENDTAVGPAMAIMPLMRSVSAGGCVHPPTNVAGSSSGLRPPVLTRSRTHR